MTDSDLCSNKPCVICTSYSSDPFIVKKWDDASFSKVAADGNAIFAAGYDQSKAYGNKEAVKLLIGTLSVLLVDGEEQWFRTTFTKQANI